MSTHESSGADVDSGRYLTFALGEESYGLEILRVQEIIGLMNITEVPRTPRCMRGVINLRGKIIPVVDVRLLFGMCGREASERTCIIVVQMTEDTDGGRVGLLVDEVSEVLDVEARAIDTPPILSASGEFSFIRGIAKSGSLVLMLLDLDRLLSESQKDAVLATPRTVVESVAHGESRGDRPERDKDEELTAVTG